MSDHRRISLSVNPSPIKGDMSVLFSGDGEPLGGHYIGPAVHDYYLIHIVLDGRGTYEMLGETHRLAKGDCFVIFPNMLMKYEADRAEPWSYMWVAFAGGSAEPLLRDIGIAPDRPVIRNCPLPRMRRLFRSLRSALEQKELGSAALRSASAGGWLRLVLSELGRLALAAGGGSAAVPAGNGAAAAEAPRYYPQIEQAMRMLSYQYGQHITIGEIARTLGYHRAHLTKLFKEATGMSPMQYLNKIRMKKAEELLESELTVAQVAASVGFNDPLFFTKQFRKWKGVSPTEFRRSAVIDAGHAAEADG